MNTDAFIESEYVTVEQVINSPTKKCIVLNEGISESTDFGNKLTLEVELDNKIKRYRPTKDTIINLRRSYGLDSKQWVGKAILLSVTRYKGKDIVLGVGSLNVVQPITVAKAYEGIKLNS